jgi:YgiT-type zinc finger domain-containing protein
MSSRSIELTRSECPECGKGKLNRILVSKTYEVDGQKVSVDGLLPFECDECKALVWPNAEVQRARQIIDLKLQKKAA